MVVSNCIKMERGLVVDLGITTKTKIMRNLKLLVFFITISVFANAQSFSYYDINSGTIKTIEGLTGEKIKLKKGIKQGRIEQVVAKKEIKYLDEFNYIPDIEKSFSDTSISIRNLIKNGVEDFYVLVGNYVDGLKQGEFKLLHFVRNQTNSIATLNYLNDTINGDIIFNQNFFYNSDYASTFLNVKISNQKISDQVIKLSGDQYIVYKNGLLDSGYVYKDLRNKLKFYFKNLNQLGEIDLFFYKSSDLFTKLNVSDGKKIISRPINPNSDNDYFFKINCKGFTMTPNRYYTYKISNGKFIEHYNCYYKNDNLNYSVNIENKSAELWYDNNIDNSIPTVVFEKRVPSISLKLLLPPDDNYSFLVNYDNDISYSKKGYYKISEIKDLKLFFSEYNPEANNDVSIRFNLPKPCKIEYKIENSKIRQENWGNSWSEYSYENYDSNGKLIASTELDRIKLVQKRNEESKAIDDLLGFKKDTDIVSCENCSKKFIKKNGVTIREVKCANTSIGCFTGYMNMKPCEWSFCSNNCSNNFQCAKCADIKQYRKNCQ